MKILENVIHAVFGCYKPPKWCSISCWAFMEYLSTIQEWTNNNSGYLSLLIFLAGLVVSVWFAKKNKRTKESNVDLSIEIIDHASMCTSFDTGNSQGSSKLHRTALILYLKIINKNENPIRIGDIRVGYRSQSHENPESWYWLNNETTMVEEYKSPMGDKVKIYPYLKQASVNSSIPVNMTIEPYDSKNGTVYFEQDESGGYLIPYMDDDFRVNVIVEVNDNIGNKWTLEGRIRKVKIEAIRELNPCFGLTRQLCDESA